MEQVTLYCAILSEIINESTEDEMDSASRKMRYVCDCQSHIAEVIDIESLYTYEWNMDHVWDACQHIDMVA
tara:strand:- start:195 stop:407 length:213 start_codon:yes stop_codon:yes gene_type:complete